MQMTTETDTVDIGSQALSELANLSVEKKPLRKILTFAISLALFIFLGWLATLFNTSFTLSHLIILIIVLFIHECSHYVGMRCFGYRNLSMFFIPFIGAAVTGYGCVSAVKKAIVYLLGPVPGLVIGYLCYGIYFFTNNPLWLKAAEMFVFINALNLLPLYPLDGGRFFLLMLPPFMQSLQVVMQIITYALLAMVILSSKDLPFREFFSGLSGLFAMSLIYLHRKSVIIATLRRSGIENNGADEKTIPDAVATNMVTLIRRSGYSKPQEIAQVVWDIWSHIQGKAPGWRNRLMLSAIYVLSWGAIIAFHMAHKSVPIF